MHQSVEVYGTETCKDTISSRQHLDLLEVKYDYIDIARDAEAAQRVKAWNDGRQKTPTVVLHPRAAECEGVLILSGPSDTELDAELDKAGLLPKSSQGDGSSGLGPSD